MTRTAAGLWTARWLAAPALARTGGPPEDGPPQDQPGGDPAGFGSDRFRPFFFIQTSDLHAGLAPNGTGTMPYLSIVLERAGQQDASFLIFLGDLIHDAAWDARLGTDERAILDSVLAKTHVPVKLLPGNHDIGDYASLSAHRAAYGADYHSFTYNNCEFIGVNSVTLRNPAYGEEHTRQFTWLRDTLAAARAVGRDRIFVLQHHPPYDATEHEPESYYNFPQAPRDQYLALARQYNVDCLVAGHVHASGVIGSHPPNPTVAGTNFVYDNNGLGYRVFRVLRDEIRHFYVRLDKPVTAPPEPPAKPVVEDQTPTTLTLSWPEPAAPAGLVRYLVERDGLALGYTVEERFTDSGLTPGTTYTYTVKACDAANTVSPPSPPRTVKTNPAPSGVSDWKLYR